ncbi:MAG TPA: BON domain-containing protein [Terriglobales bacterium]|nr:BON domain-containing protein [Terriglobales bacterium]
MKRLVSKILCIGVFLFGAVLWAQTDSGQSAAAPDNTKTNQRDRNSSEPTADQQKGNQSDRELTRAIRRALVHDKSLSTYAHNIKVIAQNGVVTLKGPVRTQEEKQSVEAKAAEVVGAPDKIHSELEVTGVEASKKPSPGHSPNR